MSTWTIRTGVRLASVSHLPADAPASDETYAEFLERRVQALEYLCTQLQQENVKLRLRLRHSVPAPE